MEIRLPLIKNFSFRRFQVNGKHPLSLEIIRSVHSRSSTRLFCLPSRYISFRVRWNFPETCWCLRVILPRSRTPILAAGRCTPSQSKRPFPERFPSAMQGIVARIFEMHFPWSNFEDSLRLRTLLLPFICLELIHSAFGATFCPRASCKAASCQVLEKPTPGVVIGICIVTHREFSGKISAPFPETFEEDSQSIS